MIEGFEWDEDKRQANIAERGVDFRLAAQIFQNPIIESEDTREEYGEHRYRVLGHVGDEYFILAYTWRGSIRRIISAWKVGDDGKKRYEAILAGRSEGIA
jgi:uncharacterized DUF497 family protein